MIYCPKCGTANRDGSRFCSACGEDLDLQSQVRDPLDDVPADDREMEETSGAPEAEDEVPAWLKELGASLSGEQMPAEQGPSEEDSELPDWLQDLRTLVPAEPEAQQQLAEEPVPDWFAAFQASAAEEEVEPVAEVQEEEIPSWLAQLRSLTEGEPEPVAEGQAEQVTEGPADLTAPGEEPEPGPEGEEEEVPDWLPGSPAAIAEETGTGLEEEEEQLPGWLAGLPSFVEEELEPGPEGEEEEIPDWLVGLTLAAGQKPKGAPEGEEGQLPDWLEALPPAEVEEPAPSPEDEEEEIPAWLAVLPLVTAEHEAVAEGEAEEIPEALAEPPSAAIAGEIESPPLAPQAEEAEIPDWLAELRAGAFEEGPPLGEEGPIEVEGPDWLVPSEPRVGEGEPLARAEIPAWLLALKPVELREEGEGDKVVAPAFEEPGDTSGLLAGLQGTLPVEMLIAQPRAVTAVQALEPADLDVPQARIFADIVGQPTVTAAKEIARAPSRELDVLPRWLIYLVLLAAVSLPLVLGRAILPRPIEPLPATVDLYQLIESLDSAAPVLVAFDYDPATSGEMDALAQALVGHLMDRGARVVAVSLLPAGAATAQSNLDRLAADRADYADRYGLLYANLGYLPGQATAVRLMGLSLITALPRDFQGTPVSDLPVMDGLTTLQDFDLILELAASQDTVRSWIEQASTPYGIPLGAGVSAALDPLARPYYEAQPRQLVGVVSGVPGAAAYEVLLSGQDTPSDSTAARLDSQLLGHLALIVILLIGSSVYLVRRAGRRER